MHGDLPGLGFSHPQILALVEVYNEDFGIVPEDRLPTRRAKLREWLVFVLVEASAISLGTLYSPFSSSLRGILHLVVKRAFGLFIAIYKQKSGLVNVSIPPPDALIPQRLYPDFEPNYAVLPSERPPPSCGAANCSVSWAVLYT
ncbi:hypothetical protein C8J57DRAFT_1236631 [Mycena rebaudengoi]|nr:hypothetical protein C8J57DRAFT_1236631 [Mycena rebaudengoi]